MTTKNWNKELLLIADFIPPNPDDMRHFDVAAQIRQIKDLGFNAQHIEATDITNGEAGIAYFKSSVSLEQRNDLLAEYHKNYAETTSHDMIYFNVHWLSDRLIQTHREWFQLDTNRSVLPISYGSGGYSCVNSPFRDWAFQMISDIGRYGVKGVFLDGPVFSPDGCYCEGCLQRFEKQYGYRYTSDMIKKDRLVRNQVLQFKHDSITAFVKDARTALKSVDPDAVIYMNGLPLGPSTCGRDNRAAGKYQDMLLSEGGFLSGDLRALPIWKPAAAAKILETQAEGKPCVIAIAGRMGPYNRYLLTPAETWIACAMTIANGANIWYGIYDSNRNDKGMETVRQINHFLTAHSRFFANTVSAANVALVWSMKNANYYQTTTEEWDFVAERKTRDDALKSDARKAFNGWFEVLCRTHVLFDVIDDDEIGKGGLTRYELVILPGTACMSGAEADQLTRFVAQGGNLIATYDTACYDETGMHLPRPRLADVLGIESVNGTVSLPFDHVTVDPGDETRGIDQTVLPAPSLYCQIVPRAGVRTCMALREKQLSKYCDLPPRTVYPLLTTADYGAGHAVLFTGNIDAEYENQRIPEYYTLMNNMIERMSSRKITANDETAAYFLNMRQQGQTRIIHLINYTSCYERPIVRITPMKNLPVSVRSTQRPRRIHALQNDQNLPFDYLDGSIRFTLPEIKEYEVVVIES
ncbi:MAG: beta-galactosidase trimerization domain-containing protein [Clostridiaceae bacterium]|nr:beta-galactosidase trimerization domain-containing protein [Clostridiaceae bacterium]